MTNSTASLQDPSMPSNRASPDKPALKELNRIATMNIISPVVSNGAGAGGIDQG